MSWSLSDYCASQLEEPDWDATLPSSSRLFLDRLGLPTMHPFCSPFYQEQSNVPGQGPILQPVHETLMDALLTFVFRHVPPHLAFIELWLRLFASVVAPASLIYLLLQQDQCKSFDKGLARASVLAVASSMILMTDSMYVLEYGPCYGVVLFLASVILAVHTCWARKLYKTVQVVGVIVVWTVYLTWGFQFGTPTDVHINVQPGLYYNENNSLIRSAVEAHWPVEQRTYHPTPWMLTGDARTGLPFMLSKVPSLVWRRVFLTVEDGEVLALDVAFPLTGHDDSKPVYLVLHGANGGSAEDYVRDLALRRTTAGSTVAVMISRGLMDVPLQGNTIYRADRVSDAHEAAGALRRAMADKNQVLAGVGYSMGSIVLNNYVATSGSKCALSVAFSVSGALECRREMYFKRPQRVWQPMIAEYSRERHVSKWGERMRRLLGDRVFVEMLRATNVVDLDEYLAVRYYAPAYRNLEHYYEEMGALGDLSIDTLEAEPVPVLFNARILNISIPLCVLHSFDDPIATWRGNAENFGLLHPTNLVRVGQGNILLLLTRKGGHVGWPTGWFPTDWEWLSETAAAFVNAFETAMKESNKGGVDGFDPTPLNATETIAALLNENTCHPKHNFRLQLFRTKLHSRSVQDR